MKTLKVTLLIGLGLLAAACHDNDDTAKLSSQEQAEMVAASMGKSGFASSSEQSAIYANDAMGSGGRVQCGFNTQKSDALSGTFGSITFSYSYAYNVTLVCDGNEQMELLTSEFTYQGSLDGPRFNSQYSGNGLLTVASVSEASINYAITGSYNRDGSFHSKIENQDSGSSAIDITAHNVLVSKTSNKIVGGSADASVHGMISGRGTYSFDAHIVFNADGTANITVSGDTYVMNLATGTITAQG